VSTAVGPWQLELETTRSLFAALLRAISYQQLHARAAEAIHGRVNALFPGSPSPTALRRLSDQSLRGAGLSAAKLLALRDLAAKAEAGIGPNLAQARRLSDEVLIERLTTVRGIGPWTVRLLLLCRLGRPDVRPVGDFAIRLAFSRLDLNGRDTQPAELRCQAERWRPWRSVARWHLWRAVAPAPAAAANDLAREGAKGPDLAE
jgi:3-methyladenine DNA glycosylase/8-oxoguanine DNA glycosylase